MLKIRVYFVKGSANKADKTEKKIDTRVAGATLGIQAAKG
jgi:hypothetical protein